MKKYCKYLIVILGMLSWSADAQFSAGAHIGSSFNTISVDGLGNSINGLPEHLTSISYGVFGGYNLTPNWTIQSEINFIKKGFTVSGATSFDLLGMTIPVGAKARTNLSYLEIPVLVKYKVGTEKIKGYIEAGPSLSYARSGNVETIATLLLDFNVATTPINFASDTYNRTEINGNIGAGVEIAAGKNGYFTAGVRYTPSFTNALDDFVLDTRIKNRSTRLTFGYGMQF